mmetsp:Transcript_35486/g.41059  ORF Transcript_35486/g.41059 Transcript_35486/m.41059 type:complete len:190 (+) Transcript_35486:1028-1597(+)
MWFGSNFVARAFIRKTKTKKLDLRKNHLEESDGSSLLSDSEIEESEPKEFMQVAEGEGEEEEDTYTPKPIPVQPQSTSAKAKSIYQRQMGTKGRAHTAGRSKRQPFIPRLIDTSRDEGEKVYFPNIDPKGYQEEIEKNDPKLKAKREKLALQQPTIVKDLGSIRPKTTDAGKRKINMLRRFHGDLINSK